MRVLFVGDIFGSTGRRVLSERLKDLKEKNEIDVCIANAENAAGGKGITLNILKKLNKYGVNVVTGGNHSMVHEEVYTSLNSMHYLLRPLNLYNENKGIGYTVYPLTDGRKIGVINLLGRTFFDAKIGCPFKFGMDTAKKIIKETPIIIIDFHAEATSEKVCLANYLDGLVSAVIGTHTHVQTCDERILPGGTAFITDAGMTGPEDSAIGMKLKSVIQKYLYQSHIRFEVASKGPMFNGVIVDIDDNTGKARSISRNFERIIYK
ncbi:MAG: TIGR00282 family metallophosphoesterase [Chitinispirillia bacterium]|jgi:metallophosphoesterase (TIGR00282 family)